tara:strand:- start:762 stop:932 length:171 start_codon:yes stop_codon:yes gene_type:complete
MKKMLIKYQKTLDGLIVMDDYDGGKAEMLRQIIEDLKSQIKLEEMEKYPHQDNHMD